MRVMEKMIDIHNHLIPKFDDGPASLEESLEMLKHAQEQGITDVFATSHFNEYIPPEMEHDYFFKLQDLREEALAQKIHIKKSRVTTLCDQGLYVLIEFPMFQTPEGIEEVLFRLSMENYIPIVAHPARYQMVLEKEERATQFVQFGGLLQLNAGSILGHFGRESQKVALKLLRNGIPHFIASDAHSPDGRNFLLRETYDFLKGKLPESYLRDLFYNNAKNIIDNIRIDSVTLPAESTKRGFLKKLVRKFR
ncbi:hypothetical protein B1H10_04395 [candidate division KSB1 bacterium 4484_188]|nr:MAG: hypothetical protein B1H10_04395 [candidate division KSB1 bacterium 4484_188]